MRVLKKLKMDNLIFIDIETTRLVEELEEDTPLYDSWEYKMKNSREAEDNLSYIDGKLEERFIDRASLFPEFAKITCISCGRLRGDEVSIKSYIGEEKDILIQFTKDLTLITDAILNAQLCAHAGIGFDVPFIMKRCIINNVEFHDLIDVSGLKPWEVNVVDTNDIWRSTSFSGASLLNICVALGIPSPKTDLSGEMAAKLYWNSDCKDAAVRRIAKYCEKDVKALIKVVRRCRGDEEKLPEVNTSPKEGLMSHLFSGGVYGKEQEDKLIKILIDAGDLSEECFTNLGTIARMRKTKFNTKDIKDLKLKYDEAIRG